jgi:hypothetical protein
MLLTPLDGLVEQFSERDSRRSRDVRLDTKRPVL